MNDPAHIVLRLPLPPSANRIWRVGRGRVRKADAYTEWLNLAGWQVQMQRAGNAIAGRFEARITMPETRIDLDNNCKPILDLLQKQQVIANDRHLRCLTIQRDPDRDKATCLVELWSLPDAAPKKRAKKPALRMAAPAEPLRR